MTADMSRTRFRPDANYAAVVEQQGRVRLDADANEGSAILNRRVRSGTLDASGRVALPADRPDSFRVDIVAGQLVIQPGRLYVDGLQAENHGTGPRTWDAALAELRGTAPTPFVTQPFRPGDPLPPLPAGRHILYLDVWQRHVSHIEDPSLVEIAVGVDTTGRIQTVWQVGSMPVPPGTGCGDDIAAWDALVTPSAGRLSSRAQLASDGDDPCLLPPGAGYSGLENRLYRVEIHGPRSDGTMGFKWAIHNATVASAILSAPANDVLLLSAVARDDVMRFNPGDWVEILDDRTEMAGMPGLMRRILSVDDAARTVTLVEPVPAAVLALDGGGPALDQDVHPRIRKWDQAGTVRDSNGAIVANLDAAGSDGLIPIPAPGTWVRLGAGVEIRLARDPVAGRFQHGDHWMFAARTAGRTVEALSDAPPAGIHHHFTRLAIVEQTASGPVVVEDCRPRASEAGCCTFTVAPGGDIQAAIDALPDDGGCVCLKAGLHSITAPIRIERPFVTLHGESLGAVVAAASGGLVAISGAATADVRVHTLRLLVGRATQDAAIAIIGTTGTHIADCHMASAFDLPMAAGIAAAGADRLSIERCAVRNAVAGIVLGERTASATVEGCTLEGTISAEPAGNAGILARLAHGPLALHHNDIAGYRHGIVVNDEPADQPRSLAAFSQVEHNRIALGTPDNQAPAVAYGIDLAAPASSVADNSIEHAGPAVIGIRASGSASRVSGNIVLSRAKQPGFSFGIGGGAPDGDKPVTIDGLQVADNQILGAQNGIILGNANRARISANQVQIELAAFGIALLDCDACHVAQNSLSGAAIGIFAQEGETNVIDANAIAGAGDGAGNAEYGIVLDLQGSPTVAGNTLSDLDQAGIIALRLGGRSLMAGNRVIRCGARARTAIGIGAVLVVGELVLESNEVMDTGLARTAEAGAAATAHAIMADLVLESRVSGNLVTCTRLAERPVAAEDRALRMRGLIEITQLFGERAIVFGFPIQISDNKFIGTGATALVELLQADVSDNIRIRFERVIVTGNFCSHISPAFSDTMQQATVMLRGSRCSIGNNHVKATQPGYRSWHFHGMPGPFVGNVSNAASWGRNTEFPAPELGFNQRA